MKEEYQSWKETFGWYNNMKCQKGKEIADNYFDDWIESFAKAIEEVNKKRASI